MKTLITIAFILLTSICFSQKKSDTLIVDFSKYKYIKIGERVFKIESPNLTEIKPTLPLLIGGWGNSSADTSKFYLPNRYLFQNAKPI